MPLSWRPPATVAKMERAMMLAFVGVGSTQLIFLAIVMLLLFGHRLPETMRNLGKGMNEFKKGMKEGEQDEDEQHRVEEK